MSKLKNYKGDLIVKNLPTMGEYEGHGFKKGQRKPPEGWSHIDWEDNLGQKWRDTVPTNIVDNIIKNRGMKLKKITRG